MMNKTMKKAAMAALAVTGAVASTSTVFADRDNFAEVPKNTIRVIVTISEDSMPVKEKPSEDSDEIGVLCPGDNVEVLMSTNGYIYVNCSPEFREAGTFGYVDAERFGKYLCSVM